MTRLEAIELMPVNASLSCSFGWPGVPGYTEYWRDPDGHRWTLCNGEDEVTKHRWYVFRIDDDPIK